MGLFDFFTSSPEKKMGKCFDNAVDNAVKSCGGNPMIAGVITFHAIAKTYDKLKLDKSMMQQCGLSDEEYQNLLDKVLNVKGREYISNWDQMRANSRRVATDY